MKCIYKDYCTLYGTSDCGKHCTKYKLMQYLLDTSGIPASRQQFPSMMVPEKDKVPYKQLSSVCNNICKYVNSGTNFVLWSENPGNGKTTWAIKMMLAYFNAIWYNSSLKPHGYFIHVPTYLSRVKAAINNPDEELEEIQRNICDIDLLILDDIGTSQMSEYDVNLLTHIIDQRWLNQKSTVYTTNRNRDKLAQVIGERNTDRIWDSCILHFTSSSNRGMI